MKKALFVFVFVASAAAMHAQVKVGIKAGGNYSNVVGNDGDGGKSKLGFHAGVQAQVPLVGGLSLQPEVVYSKQGAKSNEAGVPDLTVGLDYLNVPVMAKYTTRSGFFAETGPQVGFLLSAKAKQEGQKENVKEYFKKTDFSWGLGVGYVTQSNIGFNARYNLGLSQLQGGESTKTRNSVLQAGVFYLF